MVVQRIPIRKDGKVIAVFGQVMFKDVRDVGKLARKLSLLESKVELYEKELISLRSTRYTIDSIVGVSNELKWLKNEALKAAATNLPVSHHRRIRHGERVVCPSHPSCQPTAAVSFCAHKLRCHTT